jgi:hypothetical protein
MSITSALLNSITPDTVYVSSGNTAVTWISINNYSGSATTANVHIVPTGGTANTQNQVLTQLEIQPTDMYQVYAGGEKLILSDGESIQASANAINRLNVVVSYTEI